MESVLVKVVSFIAVIVVGYLLKRVGFFRSEDFRLIAGLVLKVTLPCAIISNFTRIDVDAALFVLVLLGLGCNLVTVAAGWLASKRGDSAEQAFNIINFSGYNVGCFALPFLQSFPAPSFRTSPESMSIISMARNGFAAPTMSVNPSTCGGSFQPRKARIVMAT